jgi:asparagine synthase (glutamine-hydrolysing)
MCGIAGFSGAFDPSLLGRMNDVIAHRGPDDEGTLLLPEHGIGLGHRRLSIIDLSSLGHQPMSDPDNQVSIVFNGEIYNYRELREELVKEGVNFRSHSDTEVLIHLYIRDQEKMLPKLNGIFAFALWDHRRKQLFIARDGMGVKPLYYAELPKGLLFGSEMKSLLQEASLSRDLNSAAAYSHLCYLWTPYPSTILTGVKKLEPGTYMMVVNGKITKKETFYDLPFDNPIEPMSVDEATQRVHDGLRTAVDRQMVADVPVGAFLSGGLDSSAVVAFARKHDMAQAMQCFTIGFRGGVSKKEGLVEDLPYARRVAKHLDVDLHTVEVGPDMVNALPTMLYHLDEPQGDAAPINALFISKLAREHDIKVLLSGAGGDDLFTGYRRHFALSQEKYWDWLPKPLRKTLKATTSLLPAGHPLSRRITKAFEYADMDGDQRLVSYFNWINPNSAFNLMGERLRDELADYNLAGPLLNIIDGLPANTPPLNRMLAIEMRYFLTDHNLNYTDKTSMAHGVEVRVPFLDPDLVDLSTRLPLNYKQRGSVGKWILKRAMEPHLPHDVIYRPKTGFGAPMRAWIQGPLADLLDDVTSPESLNKHGIFDPKAVAALVKANRLQQVDASNNLFSILCMELWCRLFLDTDPKDFKTPEDLPLAT